MLAVVIIFQSYFIYATPHCIVFCFLRGQHKNLGNHETNIFMLFSERFVDTEICILIYQFNLEVIASLHVNFLYHRIHLTNDLPDQPHGVRSSRSSSARSNTNFNSPSFTLIAIWSKSLLTFPNNGTSILALLFAEPMG